MADPIERLLFAQTAPEPSETSATYEAGSGDHLRLEGVGDEELVLSAKRKLTLRCGKSSITLHPNGKIVLRGEYILSDAEGTNRINGGRIELN